MKPLPAWIALAAFSLLSHPASSAMKKSVTLPVLHFSDYHSHAVPFFSEGKPNQAGIARTVEFLRAQRKANAQSLVFSGGDTMNFGSPSWSDKYRCEDWTWLNGLIEAMAWGNHEHDYGSVPFEECRTKIDYPIISANFVTGSENQPYFAPGGKPYLVFERAGVKIGVFALAGMDFPKLIKPANLPAGTHVVDALPVAREVVRKLREQEKVSAVLMIGHRSYEEDMQLARAVPGIDLIFGTHSHRKEKLGTIPGTHTKYISPYQYLTYISRVELLFENQKLRGIRGGLVKMDERHALAKDVQTEVGTKQKALEADPQFSERFQKIGTARVELSNDHIYSGESVIGNFVMDIVRRKTKAHLVVSTASSFRASIAPGEIRVEDYLAALPFRNAIVTVEMTGSQIEELLNLSVSKLTTDNFSQQSGARFAISSGMAKRIKILQDPEDESKGYEDLSPTRIYKVATTDFQANVSGGYRDLFARGAEKVQTGLIVNDLVLEHIRNNSPVTAKLDQRIVEATGAKNKDPR